jgi:hypothetical protein
MPSLMTQYLGVIPAQLFCLDADLVTISGIEIGEICGLFDELFAPFFEGRTRKVFNWFLRFLCGDVPPISFFHPTNQIDEKHAHTFRLYGRIHRIMCSIALGLRIFDKLLAANDASILGGWPERLFLKDIEIARVSEQIG